jgi:hypothetical protein
MVKEFFSFQKLVAYGCYQLCFPESCLDYLCSCIFTKGYWQQSYMMTQDFASQFSILPVEGVIIEASVFREVDRAYRADAGSSGKLACCDMSCRMQLCCRCYYCCEGGFRIDEQVDSFNVDEKHTIGSQPGVVKEATKVIDGTEWTVVEEDKDSVYLSLHYKSILNSRMKVCKMQISKRGRNNRAEIFAETKAFASTIGARTVTINEVPVEAPRQRSYKPIIALVFAAAAVGIIAGAASASSNAARARTKQKSYNDDNTWQPPPPPPPPPAGSSVYVTYDIPLSEPNRYEVENQARFYPSGTTLSIFGKPIVTLLGCTSVPLYLDMLMR